MLRLTLFEFIVRVAPESFIFIFATYAFSNTKLNLKRYIISSLVLSICIYTIRMLPINYGVHTILNIITQTMIVISISKIDIIQAIKSALITTICLLVSESINILVLNLIFKDKLEIIILNLRLKTIYGSPSLVIFAAIVICSYFWKKDRIKYV